MSVTTCTILISQQAGRTVGIARAAARTLRLTAAKSITLRFGNKSVNVPLRVRESNGNGVTIPIAVADALRLRWRGSCLLRVSNGRDVQVGPLVGLLTGAANGGAAAPFGGRTPILREFMNACRGRAIVFAFAPQNVDWQHEEVTGYFLAHDGHWSRRTVPLPDVIYNRLPNRRAERSVAIQSFKERFVRRRIPLFNWSFFDKTDVYKLLEDEPDASRHVPESINGPSEADMREMLDKHRFAYLKPTAGSLGFGIYRLTYTPGKGYFARFRLGSTNHLIRFAKFEGLAGLLRRHRIQLDRYVVQQGIRLIEIDKCPIDFRFHMVKDGQNRWVTVGIGAKKAGRGSVTTHIRTGGQLLTPEQVLTRAFGHRAEAVLDNAKSTAVMLAEAIEEQYPHTIGELGLDIGIDLNERVWMFEANAKPGRSIFKHPSLKQQGKALTSSLMEHCLYLSQFSARRDG